MNGFLSPSIIRDYTFDRCFISAPPELAGREVVGRIDADACRHPAGDDTSVCGLVRCHRGPHWRCSIELVDTDGPFAVVRNDST